VQASQWLYGGRKYKDEGAQAEGTRKKKSVGEKLGIM